MHLIAFFVVAENFDRTVRYLLLLREILHLLHRVRVAASRLRLALRTVDSIVLLSHQALQLVQLARVVQWLLLFGLVAVALMLELLDEVLLISGLHGTTWLVEHVMHLLFHNHLVHLVCVARILMVVLTSDNLFLNIIVRLFAWILLSIRWGTCILHVVFLKNALSYLAFTCPWIARCRHFFPFRSGWARGFGWRLWQGLGSWRVNFLFLESSALLLHQHFSLLLLHLKLLLLG